MSMCGEKKYICCFSGGKDCNKCMECVEVCQSGVLKEDRINTILTLKRFNNHLRIHAWECTYCKSCENICEREAIIITRLEREES